MNHVLPEHLALQNLYRWEATEPTRLSMTQPMGDGKVVQFNWKEVGDQVRRMASYLKAQGWEPGSKVAILSKNCAWWMMSDLAIWMAGYVSVPLYPTLAPETIAQILKHSEAKAIFIGKLDGWEGMAPGVPSDLPGISYSLSPDDVKRRYPQWDAICAKQQVMKDSPVRAADELATLIYTSGTTGNPKGVMHTFGNFGWAIQRGIERLDLKKEDRMLSYLPLAHVVERMLVEHGWLVTGMQVYFAESLDTFAADLQRARPTVFFSVPRLWTKFQQGVHHKMPPAKLQRLLSIPILNRIVGKKVLTALGLDQCRLAAGGAAHMPVSLLRWYKRLGLHINEGYGMTENLALSHITVPGIDMIGTVGKTYQGVQARVDATTGELQIMSKALMLGYYKEPELTAEAFTADGWLKTGDKAEISADGICSITGRVKDLFKTSKGKYVAPSHIEDRLGVHSAVEACMVAGANLGQPIGLVMLGEDGRLQAESESGRKALTEAFKEHIAHVNSKLDPHEQLQCLVLLKEAWTVDNGMVTPTLKVKRDIVDRKYGANYERWESSGQRVIFGD